MSQVFSGVVIFWRNIFSKKRRFISLLLILHLYGMAYAEEIKMPPKEEWGYAERYTYKYKTTFIKDDWVWVYNAEFAKRFKMPEEWVDPELKGAMAVAFRMSTLKPKLCGLMGREENCWDNFECQMDVYYDNQQELPWHHPEIKRDDFVGSISSKSYIPRGKSKEWEKYRDPKYPDSPRSTGVGINLAINGKNLFGFSTLLYFDQEIVPGIGVVGSAGSTVCPETVGKAKGRYGASFVTITEAKEIDKKDKTLIEIPESFMKRANKVYVEELEDREEYKRIRMKKRQQRMQDKQ